MNFAYGAAEMAYLSRKDKRLAEVIARVGMLEREVLPDVFEALVNAIVAQQISMKAADTVWNRVTAKFGEITPAALHAASLDDIQSCGLSYRKAGYIKNIAGEAYTGALDISAFAAMTDEEIVARLCRLNGIGVWTAEMLMIFSLQRPNVLSWGDLAIRRGLETLYRHKKLTRAQFERYRKRYSPYCSVASLYLWEVAAGG